MVGWFYVRKEERRLGLHFFSPSALSQTIRIATSACTSYIHLKCKVDLRLKWIFNAADVEWGTCPWVTDRAEHHR